MTSSNTGRVTFTNTYHVLSPLTVGIGLMPPDGIRDMEIENVGGVPFWCRGAIAIAAGTATTSPSVLLHPGHTGRLVINGSPTRAVSIQFWKEYTPRFISFRSAVVPGDQPASAEIGELH